MPAGGRHIPMDKADAGEGKIPIGKVEEDIITEPIDQHGENLSDISDSAIDDSDEDENTQEWTTPERGAATFLHDTNGGPKRKLTRRNPNG